MLIGLVRFYTLKSKQLVYTRLKFSRKIVLCIGFNADLSNFHALDGNTVSLLEVFSVSFLFSYVFTWASIRRGLGGGASTGPTLKGTTYVCMQCMHSS